MSPEILWKGPSTPGDTNRVLFAIICYQLFNLPRRQNSKDKNAAFTKSSFSSLAPPIRSLEDVYNDRTRYDEAEQIVKNKYTDIQSPEAVDEILFVLTILNRQQELDDSLELDNNFMRFFEDIDQMRQGHMMVTGRNAVTPSVILEEIEVKEDNTLAVSIANSLKKHLKSLGTGENTDEAAGISVISAYIKIISSRLGIIIPNHFL